MTLPGLIAEVSLGRTVVTYQRNMVLGGSDAVGIVPMQGFTAAPISSRNLTWPLPWTKELWCCARDMRGIPHCTYFYVQVLVRLLCGLYPIALLDLSCSSELPTRGC